LPCSQQQQRPPRLTSMIVLQEPQKSHFTVIHQQSQALSAELFLTVATSETRRTNHPNNVQWLLFGPAPQSRIESDSGVTVIGNFEDFQLLIVLYPSPSAPAAVISHVQDNEEDLPDLTVKHPRRNRDSPSTNWMYPEQVETSVTAITNNGGERKRKKESCGSVCRPRGPFRIHSTKSTLTHHHPRSRRYRKQFLDSHSHAVIGK
jgi:hypothetical protein